MANEKCGTKDIQCDDLANILKYNNLYDDLYEVLDQNNISVDKLQNDISSDAIDAFCNDIKIKGIQRIKFRKLMRIINESKNITDHAPQITILVIGDKGVGKTALINKYTHDSVNTMDYVIYPQVLSDGSASTMKIYDDNTEIDRCRPDAIIICYDKNDPHSFKRCRKYSKQINNRDVIVMVVGCKSDKGYSHRKDEESNAQMMMNQEWEQAKILAFECSAETGDNVKNVFVTVAELVLNQRSKHSIANSSTSEHKNNNNNGFTQNASKILKWASSKFQIFSGVNNKEDKNVSFANDENKKLDQWDSKYTHTRVAKLLNKTTIKALRCSNKTFYGTHVVKSDTTFRWEIRMRSVHIGHVYHPFIGIIKDDPYTLNEKRNNEWWYMNQNGYAFYNIVNCGSVKYQLRPGEKKYGEPFDKDGTIMVMTLNTFNWTLSYNINSNDYGVAFENIKKQNYRLCVSLGLRHTEMEIIK